LPSADDLSSCPSAIAGYNSYQYVDFVYYDECGNAVVTKAIFGIQDSESPTIAGCEPTITKVISDADCESTFDISVPSVSDNCFESGAKVEKEVTVSLITSNFGNAKSLIQNTNLLFGPFDKKTYPYSGLVQLRLDIQNVDADDDSEFFEIVSESGDILAKTTKASQQCGNISMVLSNISTSKLDQWLSDGFIKITLVPSVNEVPEVSINDVCPGAVVRGKLSFGVLGSNTIKVYFTDQQSKDTILVDPALPLKKSFAAGSHNISFIYEDCAQNKSECHTTIQVQDRGAPTLACARDTVITIGANSATCTQELTLNISHLTFFDNCNSASNFSSTLPLSLENQKISFRYDENLKKHLANNKVVVFNDVPRIQHSSQDAILTIRINGDVNNPTEYFTILGENGVVLGITKSTASSGCTFSESRFTIARSLFNSWLGDKMLVITAQPNNAPSEEGSGINPCVSIDPNATTDGQSSMTFTVSQYRPPLNFAINDINAQPINLDSNNLPIKLNAGIHKLKFTTSDIVGNTAQCTSTITIKDTLPPLARCKNFIASINPSGVDAYQIVADSLNNHSTDNCEISQLSSNIKSLTCSDIGTDKIVILTVTDKSGNTSTCTSTIKVQSDILKPSYQSGICVGDTVKFFANINNANSNIFTYKWSKSGVQFSSLPNPVFPNGSDALNGLYKLEVSGLNGCVAEGFLTVNIKSLTTPDITNTVTSYCDGAMIKLTATTFSSPVTYKWYEGFPPNGTLLSTTPSAELSLTPTRGAHNYYVIALTPSCTTSASITKRIVLYEKPSLEVESSVLNVCSGRSLNLKIKKSIPDFEYLWTGPNGYSSNKENPLAITNITAANQGKYKVTASLGACISDTASVEVVVVPSPIRPAISGENIYCEGSTLSLVVNNVLNQEKYIWIKDGVRFRTTQTNSLEITNVNIANAGKWTVQVEANTCLSDTSLVKLVEIDNLSVVAANNNGPKCEGDTIVLNASFVPNAAYSWRGPSNFIGSGQSITTVAVPGEYFVSITNATGCINVASTVVVVEKIPIITALSNNAKTCMDGKSPISFSPTVFPIGNYTYNWTGPNGFNFTGQELVINNASEKNNGTYTLKVASNKCISNPVSNLLQINTTPPKPDLNINTQYCLGDTIMLKTSASADTFFWFTPLSTIVTSNPMHALPITQQSFTGNYHLIVKKDGCKSTDFEVKFITINAKPLAPAIIAKQEYCYHDTITLITNNIEASNASWILPNGEVRSGRQLIIPTATKVNNGQYKVRITQGGCISPFSLPISLSVRDDVQAPKIKNEKIDLCGGGVSTVNLCIDSFNVNKSLSYIWRVQNGVTIGTTVNECTLASSTLFQKGSTFVEAYSVDRGCRSSKPSLILLSRRDSPTNLAKIKEDQVIVCTSQESLSLTAQNLSADIRVKWTALTPNINLSNVSGATTAATKFVNGLNLVKVEYSTDGCENYASDTAFITLPTKPIVNDDSYTTSINSEIEIPILNNDDIAGQAQISFTNVSNAAIKFENGKYTFTPKTGYVGIASIPYKVCVAGCLSLCDEGRVNVNVGLDAPCVVPTIFTPNGDGVNDAFVIPCINSGKYQETSLKIFNQWGDEVYNAHPYSNNWDGTYGGNPLPTGTYFYIFTPDGKSNSSNGYLILQR
jgi:gliding motility-associated-like protein